MVRRPLLQALPGIGALALVVVICPAFLLAQAPAAPPAPPAQPRTATPARDNAAPPPAPVGTAVVRGKITAAATGQPLYRVRVTMNGGAAASSPTAVTGADGMFEITGIPAGTYSITASRSGYLTVQYGQQRPRESGRTLAVKNGDVVEHIDLALFNGAVLDGRILDVAGDPVPGVLVEAMDMQYTRGHRLPLQAGRAITDDRGEFRFSGLNPGAYYLRASTMETWRDDDPAKGTYAYARTFYPGVAETDRAQTISLATGQEVDGLDFPLAQGRAVRISGVLLSANGAPIPSQVVSLDRIERTTGGAVMSAGFGGTTRTDRNGQFELHDIPPGEYHLYSGNSQTETASIDPLLVTDADFTGLVLTPRRPGSVQGTIATDDGTAPPFPASRVRVAALAMDETNVLPTWTSPAPQPTAADWSFRFGSIEGPYLFRPTGMPDDWMLQSVQLSGRDITDAPLDVPGGGVATAGVQIILTRRAGIVNGQVVTPAGTAAPDSTVIVFASDTQRWGLGTRFVKSGRPDNAGHFSVGGLPAGRYFAIARDAVTDGQWDDPEFLRGLMADATTVELSADAERTVTLTLRTETQR